MDMISASPVSPIYTPDQKDLSALRQEQQMMVQTSIIDLRGSSCSSSSASASDSSLPSTPEGTIDNAESIVQDIINGLCSTQKIVPGSDPSDEAYSYSKTIPTLVLYDDLGLELYDKITATQDYYPYGNELEIFKRHGAEIARRLCGLTETDLEGHDATVNASLSAKLPKETAHHDLDLSQDSIDVQCPPSSGSQKSTEDLAASVSSASHVTGGITMSIVELGAGSLKKTTHLLRNVANLLGTTTKSGKPAGLAQAEYYALDLEYGQLVSTLSAVLLQKDSGAGPRVGQEVQTKGICGTYRQGLDWLTRSMTSTLSRPEIDSPKTDTSSCTNGEERRAILWLGSSIGNLSPREALEFLRNELRPALRPQSRVLIGIDNCKIPEKVQKAYADSEGVTKEFILNGITVVAQMLGIDASNLSANQFDYVSRYNVSMSRNEAYLRAREDIKITIPRVAPAEGGKPHEEVMIQLKANELIAIERSYKFTDEEVHQLFHAAGFRVIQSWSDQSHLPQESRSSTGPNHTLYLVERAGFSFDDIRSSRLQITQGDASSISEKIDEVDIIENPQRPWDLLVKAWKTVSMDNLKGLTLWEHLKAHSSPGPIATQPMVTVETPESVTLNDVQHYLSGNMPSMQEWEEIWSAWDSVTMGIIPPHLLFSKPIDLRHICLFYLGHIPVFADVQLSRYFQVPYSEPQKFAQIFERGIDPNMDDPSQCHDHSQVPDREDEWPSLEEIITFRDSLRARISNIYVSISQNGDHSIKLTRALARVLWMIYEHEAMHLETLLYMLVQMNSVNLPPNFTPPDWNSLARQWDLEVGAYQEDSDNSVEYPDTIELLVGNDDCEARDGQVDFSQDHQFGWDNESPARIQTVNRFKISPRPISNLSYLSYLLKHLKDDSSLEPKDVPASWHYVHHPDAFDRTSHHEIHIRTIYGLVPFSVGKHWPVQASGRQLAEYARSQGGRLPSANELRVYFNDNPTGSTMSPVGFRHWHPVPAHPGTKGADGVWRGGMNGGVWEWSSTTFDQFEGFQSSSIYPGYSSDFFDGLHWIVLGGSWATLPRIARRKSFVNWYQANYPYVFAGARVAYDY